MNFTLGENFSELLLSIAKEKLYDYSLDKAINIISDSLVGCPKDIVFDIIFGKKIMTNK